MDYEALAQEAREFAQAHRVLREPVTADRYERLALAVTVLHSELEKYRNRAWAAERLIHANDPWDGEDG